MDIFSARVKNLLKKRKLSQSQLAAALDISLPRLNNYLSGRAEASYGMLSTIACALNTSVDYILGISSNLGEESYPVGIVSKYAGVADGAMFIEIPVYRNGENSPSSWFKCSARIKNVYTKPYFIEINDSSMEPYCTKGDLLLVAPRSYIAPVINNLNPNRLYATRLDENDSAGTSVRHCLTKDSIIFLRPSNLEYETKAVNLDEISYCPVAGIVTKIIRPA